MSAKGADLVPQSWILGPPLDPTGSQNGTENGPRAPKNREQKSLGTTLERRNFDFRCRVLIKMKKLKITQIRFFSTRKKETKTQREQLLVPPFYDFLAEPGPPRVHLWKKLISEALPLKIIIFGSESTYMGANHDINLGIKATLGQTSAILEGSGK